MSHFNLSEPPSGVAMDTFLAEGEPALITRVRLNAPRRRRLRRYVAAGGAALIVAGGGAAFAGSQMSDEPETYQDQSARFKVPTGVTEDGRTYGAVPPFGSDNMIEEKDFPDLVAVQGDHGIQGFAERKAMSKEPAAGQSVVVPVYAEDGVTKVDTYTIGP